MLSPNQSISTELTKNTNYLKEVFSASINQDFIVWELYIPLLKRDAVLIFLNGMVKEETIEKQIVTHLMKDAGTSEPKNIEDFFKQNYAIRPHKTTNLFDLVNHEILAGHTILLIDGYSQAISIKTTQYDHRNVDKPEIETVIKGPKEAFIESGEVNRSLIRKQLRDSQLITETIVFGNGSHPHEVSLMYIKNIANPDIVEKVKKRIAEIEVDHLQNLSILEQHIEERTYSLIPTVMSTERPDRAVSFLQEGHVVLLMDSSPDCLIVPVTFWSFFHTAEDQYQRWAFGNSMRLVRLFAFFIALIAPAAYIAVTNFHVEVIPTDLLLTVAATRDSVPFPALFELILIEVTFDIVREAGIRMPSKMGPVVALISALIISIAVITGGIISPVLIAVVGFSSLASFTIPTNSFNYAVRLARFGFIALAAFMGFFGIAIGVQMSIAYLTTVKSFGVPFVSPMAPHYRSSKDLLIRPPVWKQWLRPLNLNPLNTVRAKKPKKGAN